METEKNDFPNWSRAVVIAVIIVVGFFLARKQKNDALILENRGRLIIGKTMGWVHNHRSSFFSIDYSYTVNGLTYKESMSVETLGNIQTTGGNYIVKFDPQDPKNSKMLFDKEVAYTKLLNYADTGWITIPDFVIMKSNDSMK